MARIFLRTCILLLTLTLLPQVMAANVALVLSDVSGPYAEFATSFAEYSSKSHWKVSYSGKIEGLSGATSRPELIVTAGSEAFRSALALGGNTPILATLIPRNGYEKILAESGRNRSRGSTSAIYLDQPAARFASFVKKLLPGAQRVGLLISDETRPALATTRQSLGGLVLDSEDVASDSTCSMPPTTSCPASTCFSPCLTAKFTSATTLNLFLLHRIATSVRSLPFPKPSSTPAHWLRSTQHRTR